MWVQESFKRFNGGASNNWILEGVPVVDDPVCKKVLSSVCFELFPDEFLSIVYVGLGFIKIKEALFFEIAEILYYFE